MFASRLHYRAAGMVRLNCSAAGMLVAVIVAGMIGGAASAYPAVVNDDVCTFISGGNTAAPNLLIGTHLRIGLYHSELSTCTYDAAADESSRSSDDTSSGNYCDPAGELMVPSTDGTRQVRVNMSFFSKTTVQPAPQSGVFTASRTPVGGSLLLICADVCSRFDDGAMFGNGLNWFENRPTLGWTGFDVDMLEALRISGGFTYTIYSLGGPADIASNGGTYTEAAERALDSAQGNVDVIGQGTWRVNSDRVNNKKWIWSDQIVSEAVLMVARDIPIRAHFVWVAILITVFIFTVILLCATRPDPISPDDRDDPDDLVKSTLVYTADLAAILMSPAPIGKGTPDVTTIWDCQAVNCNFCVQKGAANDAYFTAESEAGGRYEGINIVRKVSIVDQIEGVLHQQYGGQYTSQADALRCDVAEVTKEDLYQWAKANPDNRCMITSQAGACIMVAINALYHKLSVASGIEMNAHDIYTNRFPLPNYLQTSKNCDPKLPYSFSNGTASGNGEIIVFASQGEEVTQHQKFTNTLPYFPSPEELFNNQKAANSVLNSWFDITGGDESSRQPGLEINRIYIIYVMLAVIVAAAFSIVFFQHPVENGIALKNWIRLECKRSCCCCIFPKTRKSLLNSRSLKARTSSNKVNPV
eukprot:gene7233-22233_t